jgi:hypothetical protein
LTLLHGLWVIDPIFVFCSRYSILNFLYTVHQAFNWGFYLGYWTVHFNLVVFQVFYIFIISTPIKLNYQKIIVLKLT